MRSKQVADNPKTLVVILDTGDEILSSLKSVARTEHLAGSSFKAIGVLSNVEFGWFNWETRKYQTVVKLEEQVELLSLIGDIALKDGKPEVHAHLVIGRRDGHAKLLKQTLAEEKETDAKLTSLSEKVNPIAAGSADRNKGVEGIAKKTVSHHAA